MKIAVLIGSESPNEELCVGVVVGRDVAHATEEIAGWYGFEDEAEFLKWAGPTFRFWDEQRLIEHLTIIKGHKGHIPALATISDHLQSPLEIGMRFLIINATGEIIIE